MVDNKDIIDLEESFKYPDFTLDVQALRRRMAEVTDEHQPLLEKWIETLSTLDKEMRHLERLEKLVDALTSTQHNDNLEGEETL